MEGCQGSRFQVGGGYFLIKEIEISEILGKIVVLLFVFNGFVGFEVF